MKNINFLISHSIVCLPVFNEEDAIGKMIDDIRALSIDLVITDGGSTDESLKIAQNKGVKILHRPCKGKGYGMLQAMQYAQKMGKEFIIFTDCDLTYPTDKIYTLLNEIQDADMVVGARSYKNMRLKSKFLNTCLRFLVAILFFSNYKDAVSGLRVVRINKYINVLSNHNMDLEIEMTGVSIRKHYQVKEIDVEYYERVGESKLSNFEILNALKALLVVRFKKM